jgi:hypothetical protein
MLWRSSKKTVRDVENTHGHRLVQKKCAFASLREAHGRSREKKSK